MNMVQSALSVSVRNLEKDLGATLFDRSTHGVRLSDAGEALLPEARRVLRDADAARDAVAAVSGGVRGRLRIGVMQSLSLIDAATLFADFHRAHPDVMIEPHPASGGSVALVDEVRRGNLDLAFAWHPDEPGRGVRVTRLASEPLVLVAQGRRRLPQGDVTLRDLAGESFVELPSGWGARAVCDRAFLDAGITRDIVVEVADVTTCVELVRAGFGVAVLPLSQVQRAGDLISRRITDMPEWGVCLLTSTSRPLSAAAATFAELVAKSMPPPR